MNEFLYPSYPDECNLNPKLLANMVKLSYNEVCSKINERNFIFCPRGATDRTQASEA